MPSRRGAAKRARRADSLAIGRDGINQASNGVGPRVGEFGFGLIPRFPYTSPYEDITIKGA